MAKDLTYISGLIGAPYKRDCYDGISFDCWSLIWLIYMHEGVNIPQRSKELWTPKAVQRQIEEWERDWHPVELSKSRFMDVIIFNTSRKMATHVGMVVDSKFFIHARKDVGVTLDRLNKGVFSAMIKKVYRYGAKNN